MAIIPKKLPTTGRYDIIPPGPKGRWISGAAWALYVERGGSGTSDLLACEEEAKALREGCDAFEESIGVQGPEGP